MSTIIITDSSCDLTLDYVEKNKSVLDVLGTSVNIDGFEYIDDLGKTVSHDEFYSKLRAGIIPSTAQTNIYKFYEVFDHYSKMGKSIIYVGLSSGLSGTYNNSIMARKEYMQDNKEADITIIDTVSASIGLGVLVVHAAEMVKEGKSKEEIVKYLEENKFNANHWFAVDDLMYLRKGGRIPSAVAVVGTALNVKPILIVNRKGELVSYAAIRGRKKSIKFLSDKFNEHIREVEDKIIIIGHGNCIEDAERLKQIIEKKYKPKAIMISELSATIASHVGPNMIAIAFIGDNREDK
ncbi:MAG: DegV family protein [Clostridiaceae bacterium]